jgi:hypothetical protein
MLSDLEFSPSTSFIMLTHNLATLRGSAIWSQV